MAPAVHKIVPYSSAVLLFACVLPRSAPSIILYTACRCVSASLSWLVVWSIALRVFAGGKFSFGAMGRKKPSYGKRKRPKVFSCKRIPVDEVGDFERSFGSPESRHGSVSVSNDGNDEAVTAGELLGTAEPVRSVAAQVNSSERSGEAGTSFAVNAGTVDASGNAQSATSELELRRHWAFLSVRARKL